MKRSVAFVLLLACGMADAKPTRQHSSEPAVQARTVMGWLESVVLEPAQIKIRAKLDTGAKTSSLHARNVESFLRDGHQWVRFIVDDISNKGAGQALPAITFERPLVRIARVKRRGQEAEQRSVVRLPFCLNGEHRETEFTLINRAGFNYPMLLGREFLKDVALVDPAATFLTRDNMARCLGSAAKD